MLHTVQLLLLTGTSCWRRETPEHRDRRLSTLLCNDQRPAGNAKESCHKVADVRNTEKIWISVRILGAILIAKVLETKKAGCCKICFAAKRSGKKRRQTATGTLMNFHAIPLNQTLCFIFSICEDLASLQGHEFEINRRSVAGMTFTNSLWIPECNLQRKISGGDNLIISIDAHKIKRGTVLNEIECYE